MTSGDDTGRANAMEPDLEQARRSSLMAHGVVAKLKEMGLPDELDEELAALSTDLGDLWSAERVLADQLRGLLRSPHDWETVGDYLVDLRATVDHIDWHVRSVRRPMNRIARCAYGIGSPPK